MRQTIFQNMTKREIEKWQKEKKKEWKKNADFWIKIIQENLDPFRLVVTNKAILESLKERRNLKILDAGCGEGYLSRILAKRGHRIFGIDFCPELIKAAKDLERKKPLGIKYFVGDFRKTNFFSLYFDIIISHQTINEIENPQKAFKEFHRILKNKGRLILLFLHPCFEVESEKYFQKVKIKKPHYLVSGIKSPSPYFYLHLPLSEWIKLLVDSGFSIANIGEPRPPVELLKKNRWWRENFKKPLFILIEAIKF